MKHPMDHFILLDCSLHEYPDYQIVSHTVLLVDDGNDKE